MSRAALNIKKEQMKNYFDYHPDSREVEVVSSGIVFNALFDFAYMYGDKDSANVEQHKRVPHITFFSDNEQYLDARANTQVTIDSTTYIVTRLSSDQTEETFQCEAWLV